ncbi:MAG: ABC transporter transmembrane domain-containing protein [Pseudomonadota bacterium]
MRQPSLIQQSRESGRPKSKGLKVLAGILPFLKPYRLQVVGALAALLIAAMTVLGVGIGVRKLVDEGLVAGDYGLLDEALIVLLAVVVVLAISMYARFYLVSWLGERVVADLRKAVYNRVLHLSPGYYEATKTSELLSRITTDTTLLQAMIATSATSALRNSLLLIGGLILLVVTSPMLTGLVLLLVPLVLVPIMVFGRKVRRLSRQSQDRVADVGGRVDETLTAIRTVQAFTHEPQEQASFAKAAEEAFDVAILRTRARAMLTAAVVLLVFGAITLILWLGGHEVIAGRLSGGELSAFIFYAVVVASSVGSLSEVVGDLQRAAGAIERLIQLLRVEPEIVAPDDPEPLPEPAQGAVALRNVRFCYPAYPDRPTLDGIDLSIAPGERVAIVGPSGAGKTTLFQLLLRFYDPSAGSITFDGHDLRRLDPRALRQRIGLVPQEPVIFSATAYENIAYGCDEPTRARVREAAEAAQALEFLEKLPEGFDSFLGERGVRLSGGQRQRVAIARALLRDPPLLLLDEATSSLDAESEQLVQQALERLMAGRTTIIIAHRLATILKADRIVVLEQGRIVEQGNHADLTQAGGLYARLAALQFDQGEETQPWPVSAA